MLRSHRKAIGVLIVLSILLSTFLTGCTGADGEIYGEQAVRDEVDRICSEPYHLEDKKLIETTPDNMEYTFRTENRDLTFTANSYLTPVYFDATPTGWYTKEISCDYIFAIHEQYEEELDAVAASCETYLPEHGWCYILDYSDISEIVNMVLEADTVWQQELEYNDSTFLRENALTTFHIVMINREYVYALGGTYHGSRNNDTYTATWTIDGDTWELVSRYDDSTLKSFGLTKNGTSIPVNIVTTEDDWEAGATFTIGVPVDDFCRFFDLTYTIDEEAGQLQFQSETAQIIF